MNGRGDSNERKIIVLVAVLFLNLILVSTNVVLDNQKTLFQNILGVIVSPFQIAFQETVDWVSHQLRHYVFLKNSFQKYHRLKKQYSRLRWENYLLKKKIHDQEFLAGLKKESSRFIKADVISIDRNFPFSSVMINKGTANGIVKDMIVLNRHGELVGKTVQPISLFSAKVRLITNVAGGIGAYIETNKLEGLLTGTNTRLCHFKYLMANKTVQIGDQVITSGTDLIFPPYIPIGKVIKAEKDYLTQKIEVEPYFIQRSIKQLIVVSGQQQEQAGQIEPQAKPEGK
jgi:rod shape-determining protein MreC